MRAISQDRSKGICDKKILQAVGWIEMKYNENLFVLDYKLIHNQLVIN